MGFKISVLSRVYLLKTRDFERRDKDVLNWITLLIDPNESKKAEDLEFPLVETGLKFAGTWTTLLFNGFWGAIDYFLKSRDF